ncbi:penicillin acylase family protein [Arenibacter latericius]|uniref:penicillin acylase family protein n=1 Tax=Arenibacter latericius TaxID=86104 RepID=UPI00047EE540|nr:penicillin acylase family protein [Arenibacter latericius]
MRTIKKVLWGVFGILIILALIGVVVIFSFSPKYSGEQELSNLKDKVEVYYDDYGIPHIYAEEEEDAYRSLGYVHAQDRLWQMELLRRIAEGKLSQMFGEELVDTDKFFLSLGIDDASQKTVDQLDHNSPMVKLAQAYLDGVNQFQEEGPTPVEFYLTGIEKRPFTIKDIHNTMGYMAFSFAMAHKTDPLLTNIKNKLGPEYLRDLEIDVDSSTTLIKNYQPSSKDTLSNQMAAVVHKVLNKLPLPLFEGSNSWVIGSQKTKNGKVILANDPHIGFAQPSVWYEAHISTPNYEKYGYHMAGIPFPLLGHDRKLAYGITMFENDDIDFYYEEENPSDPTTYKTLNGWEKFEEVNKTIKVKDGQDISFSYKKSAHGPILNGIIDEVTGEQPIAMSWIYTKMENKVMEALYGITHAQNLSEFQEALPKIHAPGLNLMYGDAAGNIAWFASAQLYKMPDSTHTKFILDGSSGKDEPLEYLDFLENPMAINPPWNYVYSANNQPDSIAGMQYPGYYLPENRAKRIVKLLEPKDDWTRDDVEAMLLDGVSDVNAEIVTDLAKLMDVSQLDKSEIMALDKISAWKGENEIDSIAPTIYHRWIYALLKNTFEDELGPEMFQQLLSTHLHKRMIAPMAKKENSIWFDDIHTTDTVENKTNRVNQAFKMALKSLEADFGPNKKSWTWGKVHTLEHEHPIGKVKALRSFLNVGPFPIGATREVINNMAFRYNETGKYPVTSGPSTRRVIDFSDVENSTSILPTGQSGNPFSKHYKDQTKMFNNGEFRKMMMNKEEFIRTKKSLLILKPKQ